MAVACGAIRGRGDRVVLRRIGTGADARISFAVYALILPTDRVNL